jgi:hypothetical protein
MASGADRAEGDIYYEDGLLSLTDFNASVQGGTVRVNGVYDTQGAQTNLSFTADNLPLDMVSACLGSACDRAPFLRPVTCMVPARTGI